MSDHHARHFDEDGCPASESVCHSYGRLPETEVKRLDTASRCYQLLAEKLPYDPSQELTVGFGNHVLKAHFSPERWPRIFVSYDGAITTMGKLPMVELELIIQAIKMLG
ncbi:hypothetical protein A2392_01240 [Candidatus Kaiserbacteria bacterium RIFOXYB1_FULL_46_14]|uniref:Uncharacterized protein n=1 Tax=Candidatus Kaiserbacteria bacterium RIFOXYB1_FULL_46_14 TaxID=1798531 RepID=A0A1F6FJN9_9BACT|nr:MAG: hypothetical protein A2392_01240 [Candidatus Kaiserbacteria bacterium RIFOXYB1_FULL_46_14]